MEIIVGYFALLSAALGGYLYVRKRRQDWKYKNYLLMMAVISVICLAAGVWEQLDGAEKREISELKRNAAGQGDTEIPLVLESGEFSPPYQYSITVEEQHLTEAEAEQIFAAARKELETVILGENQSPEEITSSLNIPTQLLDGLAEVSCTFEPYDLIETDGTILWDNLKGDTGIVKVAAQLSCQNREAVHEFYLQLVPGQLDGTEALLKELKLRLAQENERQGQEYLSLPREIDGIRLSWYLPRENWHWKLLLLGISGMIVWYVYGREKQQRQQKEWSRQLMLDYPDIVSRLSLLSGAGMTISGAWAKMAGEYRAQREAGRSILRPGYEEMLKTWFEMQDGMGEIKAYENFGQRCGQPQYRKFASLLMQNVRKGTHGMQQLLDAEAEEAFAQRKAFARQLGEEAGTKLLLPMGAMLILVFAVLLLPAMLSMGI